MSPAPQSMQDVVNAKNAVFSAKYAADVENYKTLAAEWVRNAVTAVQSGFAAPLFTQPLPRKLVVTLGPNGIEEDYAPADLSLTPALPKIPPPPAPTNVFGGEGGLIGNKLEKVQDQNIAEMLRILRALEALLLKPPAQ